MARPPLPIGTFGSIATKEVRPGVYRAHTRFRDFDGVTREIKATGRSAAAAARELKAKIADRSAPTGDLIGPDMPVSQVADIWLSLYRAEQRSEETTANEYQRIIDNVINPTIGNIRLREATAGRLERLIRSQESHSRRKKTKTVLKMMLDSAVIDDALPANPVSSTSRLRGQKKEVQALSPEDLNAVRSAVDAWMTKKRPGPKPNSDMPDIVDLLLATGCRIGEVLAIRWTDVDLSATPPTVSIAGPSRRRPERAPTASPSRSRTLPSAHRAAAVRCRRADEATCRTATESLQRGLRHTQRHLAPGQQYRAAVAHDPSRDRLRWVTPHTFRKTVATLIDRLVDSDTAARLLGHSPDAITKEFYIEKDRTTHQT